MFNAIEQGFCDFSEFQDLFGAGQVVNFNTAENTAHLRGSSHGAVFPSNLYVNSLTDQNASVLDQQYMQGMQNQQGLLWQGLSDNTSNNQQNYISSVFKLHQDNDSVGSPTLTTNSERSEITEASSGDFSFQRRLPENFAVQQQIFSQHSPMQQSGYDEMQLLQQQVMLKQLHALQTQQQLQQQNFLNPYPSTNQKNVNNSGQFPPSVDDMPLNDSSQGYINWAQRSASPSQQGMLNRTMFSMGLGSQQLDISLYGTPVANARGNVGQQPPIQGMYQEPGSLAARPSGGQSQKSLMQLPEFNNPFLKSQYDLSPVQGSLQQGPFMSNLGVQGRGISEAGSVHGLNNGILSGNLLMGNSQQFNTSTKDPSGRPEEQASWSSFQQKDTKLSQGLVPLDPLEEKILFSMEDSSISEIASGVFGDSVSFSSPFPSMQSGSWSALMQTAVAEASSSDTGLQEEFGGLTYQNMELSADNNSVSNFMDNDKQQAGCVNNSSLQGSASNSSFPGFQLPSDQLRPGLFQDGGTPDSTQMTSNVSGHWVDCNSQQTLSRGNQQVQSGVSFDNSSTSNMYLQSSGMLDQLQSQKGNHRSSTADSSTSRVAMPSLDPSQGGKWMNVPGHGHLGKVGMFPQFIPQNDSATVSLSQMQTINTFAASQPDNTTFPGAILDGHTSSQSRSPQQGTNRQFNVWMDLPTRQDPLDQESNKVPLNTTPSTKIFGSDMATWQKAQPMSSAAYNMPQRASLPQEQGAAAAKNSISELDAPNRELNKLQGENDMVFGTSSKLYEQNYAKMPMDSGMSSMSQLKSFAFHEPKMDQNVYLSGKQPGGSSGMEHSHLNLPASTPMWFKQMEAFRNDQMLPAHAFQETPDQLLQFSKPLNPMNKLTEIITSKKRKLMRTKQLAWHEEISNASQRDHTISEAEEEWARAANRIVEKVEYDTQTFEFAPPLHRSKRRLVLTAQHMQQLFDPPSSVILFSAASSTYDTLLFFVARATLGDACSLTHKGGNALSSSSGEVEKIPEKIENLGRMDMQHSEVAKTLAEKTKKLEESFERLEKMPSMADIKFEIEDIERFSVINRFARFHSRGPVDNNSGSPSQSPMLKPIPQRYIAVGPMPRNLPEGLQCFSL